MFIKTAQELHTQNSKVNEKTTGIETQTKENVQEWR
jgi:hypothetical protein